MGQDQSLTYKSLPKTSYQEKKDNIPFCACHILTIKDFAQKGIKLEKISSINIKMIPDFQLLMAGLAHLILNIKGIELHWGDIVDCSDVYHSSIFIYDGKHLVPLLDLGISGIFASLPPIFTCFGDRSKHLYYWSRGLYYQNQRLYQFNKSEGYTDISPSSVVHVDLTVYPGLLERVELHRTDVEVDGMGDISSTYQLITTFTESSVEKEEKEIYTIIYSDIESGPVILSQEIDPIRLGEVKERFIDLLSGKVPSILHLDCSSDNLDMKVRRGFAFRKIRNLGRTTTKAYLIVSNGCLTLSNKLQVIHLS